MGACASVRDFDDDATMVVSTGIAVGESNDKISGERDTTASVRHFEVRTERSEVYV